MCIIRFVPDILTVLAWSEDCDWLCGRACCYTTDRPTGFFLMPVDLKNALTFNKFSMKVQKNSMQDGRRREMHVLDCMSGLVNERELSDTCQMGRWNDKKKSSLISYTWRFKSEFNPSVLLMCNRVEKSLVFRQQKSHFFVLLCLFLGAFVSSCLWCTYQHMF